MAILLVIIYMLVLVIFGLVVFAVMQIKMAGLTVKDFYRSKPRIRQTR